MEAKNKTPFSFNEIVNWWSLNHDYVFSLGGFTALVTAAGLPEQVAGVVLLNSAGQFGNANAERNESEETGLQKFILKPLKTLFQRIVLGVLFWQAKQPARIKSVLNSVCLTLTSFPTFFSFLCVCVCANF